MYFSLYDAYMDYKIYVLIILKRKQNDSIDQDISFVDPETDDCDMDGIDADDLDADGRQ
jgi:hypothetical protein